MHSFSVVEVPEVPSNLFVQKGVQRSGEGHWKRTFSSREKAAATLRTATKSKLNATMLLRLSLLRTRLRNKEASVSQLGHTFYQAQEPNFTKKSSKTQENHNFPGKIMLFLLFFPGVFLDKYLMAVTAGGPWLPWWLLQL